MDPHALQYEIAAVREKLQTYTAQQQDASQQETEAISRLKEAQAAVKT